MGARSGSQPFHTELEAYRMCSGSQQGRTGVDGKELCPTFRRGFLLVLGHRNEGDLWAFPPSFQPLFPVIKMWDEEVAKSPRELDSCTCNDWFRYAFTEASFHCATDTSPAASDVHPQKPHASAFAKFEMVGVKVSTAEGLTIGRIRNAGNGRLACGRQGGSCHSRY